MLALAECEAPGVFLDTRRPVLGKSVLTSRLQEPQGLLTRTKELDLQLNWKGSPTRRQEAPFMLFPFRTKHSSLPQELQLPTTYNL